MTLTWTPVNDDELRMADKLAYFLQGEFCPPGADPIWSAEYFRWKLGPGNPAGRGHASLAVMGDRIVGSVTLTRKRMLIDGKECIGGEVGDTYSSAGFRRSSRPAGLSPDDPDPGSYVNKSIFGRLASDVRRRAEADGVTAIFGTPNRNAYPGWVGKLGYYDLAGYRNLLFTRPAAGMVARRHPSLAPVGRLLEGLERSSLAAQALVYRTCLCRHLAFQDGPPAARELDELWARLKPGRGFSLLRDAAYWRHRYLEHPLARYTFFSIREEGRLAGVAVARLYSIGNGRRAVAVAEWMISEGVPFGYVLSSILNYFKGAGADVFAFWAGRSTREARAAAGNLFFSRHRIPIVFTDSSGVRVAPDAPGEFRFYLGSSDNV
jgi:hypothetical protein